jgi:hypothetical protein
MSLLPTAAVIAEPAAVRALRDSLGRTADAIAASNISALESATAEQQARLMDLREILRDAGDGGTASLPVTESYTALALQLILTTRILQRSYRTLSALQTLAGDDRGSYSATASLTR